MNLQIEAKRIEGYLLAVATLKGDGTHFQCIHLGAVAPENAVASVAEAFTLPPGSIAIGPDKAMLNKLGAPADFSDWALKRFRSMGGPTIDPCLVSGLAEELADIFTAVPKWFCVRRIGVPHPPLHMGAIWAVFVLGSDAGSLAIHCSWDD